jgi:hypothetical protein
MGDFVVPVGIPLLSDIVRRADSPDPKAILRRRQALSALVNLGNNIKGFHELPAPQQEEILVLLGKEAGSANPRRAAWARHGLAYLDKRRLPPESSEALVQMDQVLAQVAGDSDQFLRELVAFAFNFWDGPLAEPTLQRLARDQGHGSLARFPE